MAKNGSIFIVVYICALYLISDASLVSSPGQPRYNQCIPIKDLMRHVLFQSLLHMQPSFVHIFHNCCVSLQPQSVVCAATEPGIPAEQLWNMRTKGSPDEEVQSNETEHLLSS